LASLAANARTILAFLRGTPRKGEAPNRRGGTFGQFFVQTPATQRRLPAHAVPHAPQFCLSTAVSTQRPLQREYPVLQMSAQLPP
jgi:hypothetical protein